MRMKKALVSALLAAGMLGAAAVPGPAAADVSIALNFGPPPPRYEVVPAPRPGFVWAQGHWGSDGHRHIWYPGHWVQVRPGYVYRAPAWTQGQGRWVYHAPGWDSDADHSRRRFADGEPRGIPGADPRINRSLEEVQPRGIPGADPNPGRRFADNDRDGIPNHRDATPNGRRSADRDRDGVPDRFDARPDNPRWH